MATYTDTPSGLGYERSDLNGWTDGDPVYIVLHGQGGSPATFQANYEAAWGSPPGRLIFPEGPDEHANGYRWIDQTQGDASDWLAELEALRPTIATFVQSMQDDAPNSVVVVGGESQGCMVAIDHVVFEGDSRACSGWVMYHPTPFVSGESFPGTTDHVEVGHADGDPLVPFADAQTVAGKLIDAGITRKRANCTNTTNSVLRKAKDYDQHSPPPDGWRGEFCKGARKYAGCL